MAWNIMSAVIKGLPIQVGYFLDQQIKKQIQAVIIEEEPDHIYAQLIRTAEYVKSLPLLKTLDYMDVFSVGMKQRAERGPQLLRPLYRFESRRLNDYERNIYREFNHHCIISKQDRDRLPLHFNKQVEIVSNGVDTDYFAPDPDQKASYDLVFVGNMGYMPNVEAAKILVKKIMPVIWEQKPETTLLIAGARPDRQVQKLSENRVKISGWVDDIRTAYLNGRILVAPITSGIGQQNKILEGMSMGLPCITTKMVNNAIGALDGETIILASGIRDFAVKVLSLMDDPGQQEMLGSACRNFVITNFNWEKNIDQLENLFLNPERLNTPVLK
jgi:glycosyltransferase involved in cell wall biosynthesis